MAGTIKRASISDDGLYRYWLSRVWDQSRPYLTYVMLNPSTADAEVDDATIRSCTRLAKSWNYGGFVVVNLFAWRATNPKDLLTAPDPIGPENEAYIGNAIAQTDFTICAWGANKMAQRRAVDILQLLRKHDKIAHCLGTTKNGAPKHPLYIKTGTTPELWSL